MTVLLEAVHCRRCGHDFQPRLLTEFQGIEVWERRYCTDCASARILEENAWDAHRQKNVPADRPLDEQELFPTIRDYAALVEDLERHMRLDAGLMMVLERAYLKNAYRVTELVDYLLTEIAAGKVDSPTGLLHHRLKQILR